MKITDRIKKIKKLVGSNIKLDLKLPSEEFEQIGDQGEILDLEIEDIYEINLLVKFKGYKTLPYIGRVKLDKISRVPLVIKDGGRIWYYSYDCDSDIIKNVFFTKNDYNSSLISDYDENIIDIIEEELRKINININVQKQGVPQKPISAIMKKYGVNLEQATHLNQLGLTVGRWKDESNAVVQSSNFLDQKIIYEIHNNIIRKEELVIQLGLLKLTKERKERKNG